MACFGLIMVGVAIMQVAHVKATTNNLLTDCDSKGYVIDAKSIYGDFSIDIEDVMALYHKTINDKFNDSIKKMINSKDGDDNGKPPTDDQINQAASQINTPGLSDSDKREQAIETLCSDDANYSTFCLSNRLLNSREYGYLQYRYVLSCRRYDIDQSIQTQTKPVPQYVAAADQGQKDTAIGQEIDNAKKALDQTLSAYDQLKTSWLMHQRYMKIYKSLTTYRDKMADIRQQIENFPGKFIDVSTTKCT